MPVGEARRILTADDVHAIVVTFRDLLRTHQESINRLNVYPVPDGDTGTNMALTMESVVAEVEALVSDTDEPDMAAVCRAIGHGALMGGRGNSGVILSQILRALSLGFADAYAVGPVAVAQSLESAATGAYEAVSRPVEGTILTVARDAAAAATRAVDDGAELVGVIEAARVAGGEALARTPEQLPVLAAAGVVDAGGAGLLLLLDAALHVVDGRDLPVPIGVPAQVGPERVFPAAAQSGDDLRFEVMYLLEADDAVIPAFRRTWEGLGDSIVVVGGDGLWNCHVHTDDVGAAVEAGIEAGRPRSIRVTDLRDEVEEERWVREAAGRLTADGPGADGAGAAGDRRASAGLDDGPAADGPIVCGVVAVAVGTGVERLLRSLGAQEIVSGGQSMNPSVAELLDAIGAVAADDVVVLPNNKNIVPVALQAAELSPKRVVVIPTRGVSEGLAALLAYDPDADAAANEADMSAGAAAVTAGEVTRAVRDSSCELGPIAEGDYLGIARDGIRAVESSLAGATTALLDALVVDGHELVMLIEGEGSGPVDTETVTSWLAEHHPGVVLEVHHGGQPLYPYLVGVE